MTVSVDPTEVSDLPLCTDVQTIIEINQLYGRQSHLIDSGRALGWAQTFTTDGIFESPSYPAPVAGRAALIEFARAFLVNARAAGEVRKHVINNLTVAQDETQTWVEAYVTIAATPIGTNSWFNRLTVVRDRLEASPEGWRIAHRHVHREDLQ
ncbi:nuclear transport factor 2 family protein [Jatrophihabitans sp. DSM 45814]